MKLRQIDREITCYEEALDLLKKRNKLEVRLPGADTKLVGISYDGRPMNSYSISVVYRGTPIVSYESDGSVSLNSGGWYSNTTARKINSYTGGDISIRTLMGLWIVYTPVNWQFFRDGIVVTNEGYVWNGLEPAAAESQLRLYSAARSYVKKFANALQERKLLYGSDLSEIGLLTEERARSLVYSKRYPESILLAAAHYYSHIPETRITQYLNGAPVPDYAVRQITHILRRYIMKSLNLPL